MMFDFEGLTLFTNIFWSVSLCSQSLIKPNRIPYSNKPKTKIYKNKPENYFKTITIFKVIALECLLIEKSCLVSLNFSKKKMSIWKYGSIKLVQWDNFLFNKNFVSIFDCLCFAPDLITYCKFVTDKYQNGCSKLLWGHTQTT